MKLEIIEDENAGYTIIVENTFFRHCRTYPELAKTIGSLVKSKFLKDASGFV